MPGKSRYMQSLERESKKALLNEEKTKIEKCFREASKFRLGESNNFSEFRKELTNRGISYRRADYITRTLLKERILQNFRKNKKIQERIKEEEAENILDAVLDTKEAKGGEITSRQMANALRDIGIPYRTMGLDLRKRLFETHKKEIMNLWVKTLMKNPDKKVDEVSEMVAEKTRYSPETIISKYNPRLDDAEKSILKYLAKHNLTVYEKQMKMELRIPDLMSRIKDLKERFDLGTITFTKEWLNPVQIHVSPGKTYHAKHPNPVDFVIDLAKRRMPRKKMIDQLEKMDYNPHILIDVARSEAVQNMPEQEQNRLLKKITPKLYRQKLRTEYVNVLQMAADKKGNVTRADVINAVKQLTIDERKRYTQLIKDAKESVGYKPTAHHTTFIKMD